MPNTPPGRLRPPPGVTPRNASGCYAVTGRLVCLLVFAVLFLTLGRRDGTKRNQKSPALILLAAAGAGRAFLLLHHLHHF